ncbi:DUF4124 domain-containing protein [Geobacter argillaceus]|uniref:Uncharacterized protein DUF4124 n=1 Tax=Geobacter argillaceus TaxID=345631 RepID=A0A562VGR5_9BACT|nr:DUF4124 domain-containing protein [Geobacter argillaceus]TWJ17068.1 uncharacterized protein DUF4124 [Geobacter argillaceus]
MLKKLIVLLVMASLAVPVQAAIYKWVDQRGTVYFTEDLGKVPPAFRKKAQVINGEGEPAVEVIESAAPEGKKPRKDAAPKEDGQTTKTDKKKPSYGGKDEDSWRNEFGRLKDELRTNEEYLAETRKRKEDTANLSRRDYLSLQQTEKDVVSRIDSIKRKLQSLTEKADKAGVPKELR